MRRFIFAPFALALCVSTAVASDYGFARVRIVTPYQPTVALQIVQPVYQSVCHPVVQQVQAVTTCEQVQQVQQVQAVQVQAVAAVQAYSYAPVYHAAAIQAVHHVAAVQRVQVVRQRAIVARPQAVQQIRSVETRSGLFGLRRTKTVEKISVR